MRSVVCVDTMYMYSTCTLLHVHVHVIHVTQCHFSLMCIVQVLLYMYVLYVCFTRLCIYIVHVHVHCILDYTLHVCTCIRTLPR